MQLLHFAIVPNWSIEHHLPNYIIYVVAKQTIALNVIVMGVTVLHVCTLLTLFHTVTLNKNKEKTCLCCAYYYQDHHYYSY